MVLNILLYLSPVLILLFQSIRSGQYHPLPSSGSHSTLPIHQIRLISSSTFLQFLFYSFKSIRSGQCYPLPSSVSYSTPIQSIRSGQYYPLPFSGSCSTLPIHQIRFLSSSTFLRFLFYSSSPSDQVNIILYLPLVLILLFQSIISG